MVTLESTPDCLGTPRILFALEEMGAEYEVDLKDDGHFTGTYGTIGPALVEGERRLFEGNPILRHLARTHGLGRLMPSDPWGQAEVDSWLDFLVLRIGMSFVQGMPDAAFRYMAVIDRRLATNEWLCGAFTAADCGFITMADMSAKLPEDELPHLTAYLDRLVARPACGRARAAWTERRSQSVSREKSR